MSNETEMFCGNCGLPIDDPLIRAGLILVCQQCSYFHNGEHGLSFMAAYALGVKRGREAGMTEAAEIAESYRQMICPVPTPERISRAILTARDAKKL